MQYTKEPIDKNPERGSPDSTEHASAANILPIHSISTSALGLTEAQVYSGVDDSARCRGVASDVQVPSQVFPYGAPDNRGASIAAAPECQGPNMCKQTSSENETVGPIINEHDIASNAPTNANQMVGASALHSFDVEQQSYHRNCNIVAIMQQFRLCEVFTGLVTFMALVVVWYYNSRRG